MTPEAVFTLRPRALGRSGPEAFDLAAIRRTDAIIDLLASRRLRRPSLLRDPAVLLLGALAADVDAEGLAPAAAGRLAEVGPAAARPGAWDGAAGNAVARGAAAQSAASAGGPGAAAMAEWVRTAAAAAVIAALAGAAATTGIAVTGMVMRLARQVGPSSRPVGSRTWGAMASGQAARVRRRR